MSETGHHFSKRTSWDLSESSFSRAIAAARVGGSRELLDLTVSNPTRCGFEYDAGSVIGPLSSTATQQQALVYDPDPRGMRSAREAVAGYYADHGASIDPDCITLTTSTSEAYTYLFRMLCDAGDEILVAQPSYPLFEFLADLDDVRLKAYPLFYDYGWWIDFAELEHRIGPKTRAILVVHPNNPTGHWTQDAERNRLEKLCKRHGLALIVDEVFLDYPICNSSKTAKARSFSTGPHRALTFVMSGISKIAALPQMKVAWIVSCGPATVVAAALSRLEVIADTFLSMNAPMQLALPIWLAGRGNLQRQIKTRTESNLEILSSSRLEVLHLEAGWSAVLVLRENERNPSGRTAERLLERTGVIVHPGEFYGLTDSRFVVVSLITLVDTFHRAIEQICLTLGERNPYGYSLGE